MKNSNNQPGSHKKFSFKKIIYGMMAVGICGLSSCVFNDRCFEDNVLIINGKDYSRFVNKSEAQR